jgi:hypothetical protein
VGDAKKGGWKEVSTVPEKSVKRGSYIRDGRGVERAAEKKRKEYQLDPQKLLKRAKVLKQRRMGLCKRMAIAYKDKIPCVCGETDVRVLSFWNAAKLSRAIHEGNVKGVRRMLVGAKVRCLNCSFASRSQITTKDKDKRAKKEYLASIKAERTCSRCKNNNPLCLVFHHVDEKTKDVEVSVLVRSAWVRLKAEIEKCEVLCHNCHLKHHLANGFGDRYDAAHASC